MTEYWSGRRALVTGAAGFLGSWVCSTLAGAGAKVVGLDREWDERRGPAEGVERIEGDVGDAALLGELVGRVDDVLHLAAQSIVGLGLSDPVLTFDVNGAATWNLLEICRRAASPPVVVVASSDKAYGDAGGEPYVETMPLRATDPYSASKACADIAARSFAATYGLRLAVTRCANLYGPRDLHWSRLVPGTIRSVLREEPPIIRSDGTFVRDYLHVQDAAEATALLSQRLGEGEAIAGEAFNFGASDRHTAVEVVECILRAAGSDLEPDIRNEASHEIREQRVDASKARGVLGWAPRRRLAEATMAETVDWYRGLEA